MVAHTTQFVQPGWRFADRDGCKIMEDQTGSVVSYVSPSGKDLSIVIETAQSNSTNTVRLQLSGAFAQLKQLHMWKSERGSVFIEQALLALADGAAVLTIPPGVAVSLTSTTGQKKGGVNNSIPPRTNMSLPYEDDFDSIEEDHTPKYTSDMHGVFTAASDPSVGGKVLQQRTAIKPMSTAGGGAIYATIIGDGSWIDYEVSITARLPKAAVVEQDIAEEACTFNETVGRCGGLMQLSNATSFAECQALCCAQGTSCETAQWCPKEASDCAKWAVTGRCWTGSSCRSTDKGGWQTAARGVAPAPPKKPSAPPFLFLASHIGVYKQGSTCILSGKPLPEVCDEALIPGRALPNATSESCCPIGKGGLAPAIIHSSGTPNVAGFVYRIDFDAAGGNNATWLLQTAKTCEDSGRGCTTSNVATGALIWAIGEWMTLKLSAKRQGNGKTELKWSAQPLGSDVAGRLHTATVDTLEEARAGVAFGNAEAMSPLSSWDNLSVTPVKSDDEENTAYYNNRDFDLMGGQSFKTDDGNAMVLDKYTVTAQRDAGPFFNGSDSVFGSNYNAAAFDLPDGGKVLAVQSQCGHKCLWPCFSPRCKGRERMISVITFSRLISGGANGSVGFTAMNDSVILSPAVFDGPNDESYDVEDPRVVRDPKTKIYYMTYTCFGSYGYNLCWAVCKADPSQAECWQRRGRVLPYNVSRHEHPFDGNSTKSGSLLIMLQGPPHYLIYYFEGQVATTMDLQTFTPVRHSGGGLVSNRPHTSQSGIEPGPQPLQLSDGNYLYLFMGTCHPGREGCTPPMQNRVNTSIQYAPTWAILNGSDPTQVIARADTSLLLPDKPWEVASKSDGWGWETTPGVIFVEGWWRIHADSFMIVYGGANSVICTAVVSVAIDQPSRSASLKSDDDSRTMASSSAPDWWFTAPAPGGRDAVTLTTSPNGSLLLSSDTLAFRFNLSSSDVLLASVGRHRCPEVDCDGAGDFFSFPGMFHADCNQVNCSASRPQPVPHEAMATVKLDGRLYFLGHPSAPVPSTQRWHYEGHEFRGSTLKRFHYIPGRKGAEDLTWPPKGGALSLQFSLQCARLPTPRSGLLRATLIFELYAGAPFFVKRMNVSNGCDAPIFISDKLFEQPSQRIHDGYSQYITFAHLPAYSFPPGATFEAPYTLGDFSTALTPEVKAIQQWHFQRLFEPQKFEALATFAVWDVDQTALVNKGIIEKAWWPDVPTKVKSIIDEAAECGFEALLYNTDHMGGATLDGRPITMYLEYGSPDPKMIARTRNLTDHAHEKALEFWLYKGDQSGGTQFNWTQNWMMIHDTVGPPPPSGWSNGNGFCPSSAWGEEWMRWSQHYLTETRVDGSSCDYCWIIATMASRPMKSIGCHAHNHTHVAGAGQWESLQWWIQLTLRNFALPKAWQPATGSGRYTYGMGGGFPGNTFEMGGCDSECQWQQETASQAEMKTVECRECFTRQSVQGGTNGGGAEIKLAWMFGGHLWNSGTPGYVKPYTPAGADINYEQLCFMVASFVGTGAQGHLTGYKVTSSATSTKMLKGWMDYRKSYNRLLTAPAVLVRPPACVFPTGGGCDGWNVSETCWQNCDLNALGFDGLLHYLPVGHFPDEKVKALLVLYLLQHIRHKMCVFVNL